MAVLAKLGNVVFSVISSETVDYVNNITDKPTEDGGNVSDNIVTRPIELKITGMIVGSDATAKENTLLDYRNNAALLKYVGRNLFENVTIKVFAPTKDNTIINGFKFNMTLRQVRIAKVETTQIDTRKIIPAKVVPFPRLTKIGNIITSSGIGLGITKALGFITTRQQEVAENIVDGAVSVFNTFVNFKKKIFGGQSGGE